MSPLIAMAQPPPFVLGFAEVLTVLVVSAAILAFTGPKLLDDIRRWTGAAS